MINIMLRWKQFLINDVISLVMMHINNLIIDLMFYVIECSFFLLKKLNIIIFVK